MERWALVVVRAADGPGCERVTDDFLAEPVSALTSLAFVAAAAFLAAGAVPARSSRDRGRAWATARIRGRRDLLGYAALVIVVGVGSFVQHGPDPAWSDVAHDLPLVGTLAFLGADAAADLVRRRRQWWWWVLPTATLVPVIVAAPRLGDLAQIGVAVVVVCLTVLRAAARPALRRAIAWALALLVAGATLGALSRAGGLLCDPASPWQGHGAWHVLAAAALLRLGPTVGHSQAR